MSAMFQMSVNGTALWVTKLLPIVCPNSWQFKTEHIRGLGKIKTNTMTENNVMDILYSLLQGIHFLFPYCLQTRVKSKLRLKTAANIAWSRWFCFRIINTPTKAEETFENSPDLDYIQKVASYPGTSWVFQRLSWRKIKRESFKNAKAHGKALCAKRVQFFPWPLTARLLQKIPKSTWVRGNTELIQKALYECNNCKLYCTCETVQHWDSVERDSIEK